MEIIRLNMFELYMSNGDGIGSTTTAFTRDKKVAEEYKVKTKNWGGYREFDKTFVIVSSLAELDAAEKEKVKERALKKLTPEEREVLGL